MVCFLGFYGLNNQVICFILTFILFALDHSFFPGLIPFCEVVQYMEVTNLSLMAQAGYLTTVEPRLSGLVGTSVKSPDNRESG